MPVINQIYLTQYEYLFKIFDLKSPKLFAKSEICLQLSGHCPVKLNSVQDNAESNWAQSRTTPSQIKLSPGQRRVKLNSVQDNAKLNIVKSNWTLSRTTPSQIELSPGQRQVKLNSVQDNAKLNIVQSNWTQSRTTPSPSWSLSRLWLVLVFSYFVIAKNNIYMGIQHICIMKTY